jgi:hypothetical protein
MTATAILTPLLARDPAFAPASRVWIYTANRALTEPESAKVQQALDVFVRQWTAHNQALTAKAEVFNNQLIILMVDETGAGASGCSIDKSVHFLEQLGAELGVDFFERMRFAWVENGALRWADRHSFAGEVTAGRIGADTPVLNTLVQSKHALETQWLVPFAQSWHRRLV